LSLQHCWLKAHNSIGVVRRHTVAQRALESGNGAPACPLGSIAVFQEFHIIEIMKSKDAITALSALASESRLAVYRLLVKRGPDGYTPSELAGRLDIPAPTLSFHLKGLVQAGLVVSRREARNLFYSPNFVRMSALVGFLTENCCSLADKACGTTCEPQPVTAEGRKRA
jgi:DNA-binding transcriptional ArsR family regulator